MNTVIDIGNTLVKGAIFKKDNIIWHEKAKPKTFLNLIQSQLSKYQGTSNLLFSATGHINQEWIDFFNSNFKVYEFNHNTPLPFKNHYKTPNTLGLDRIALVAAAQYLYSNKNVLIIDAGTCITYDFKSSENDYLGGNISPGLDMRFKALNRFTANLPRLKLEKPSTFPLGKTTKDAILNGVIQGVVDEIDQNIKRYKSEYKDLTVILTGGDQQYLSAQLKNSIFANSTFQLVGLNAILEYLLND
ncbi:type III pantothenate kinase [Flavobacteriaceae bacterium 14752]|uniref:type III pantothenate kinase n=1 Tax=Mesohalobacter salilacus TaxID=2491711 RepID=UPI000F643981|nr:type III pantothenate kinase [Flavobacteriaceae bacterium 14752]